MNKARSFICAANWKMNLSFAETHSFLQKISKQIEERLEKINKSVVSDKVVKNKALDQKLKSPFCIFPQAVQASLFKGISNLNWGAQDFYFESSGAFTGQNSPDLYKELGANIMLIGHSERRTLFNETNLNIAKKIGKCLEMDMIPMLCIGETIEDRKKNETLKVIEDQLKGALGKSLDVPETLIVAYEPVWAIGTGLTAKSEDVADVHKYIKSLLNQGTPILYGGSVKPENAKELSLVDNVDGFLIGGASLKVDSLLSIYDNACL